MFNKTKPTEDSSFNIPPAKTLAPPERAPEPVRGATPASPVRSTTLSTLSAGVRYEGNISGTGDIQVDSGLKGDIRMARVVIGDSGVVEGAITADAVEVRGRVNGSITAKSIRLLATARVEGDLTHEQLAVEPGAWFQGRSMQAKRELPSAVAEAPEAAPRVDRYQPDKPVAPALPTATPAEDKAPLAKSA